MRIFCVYAGRSSWPGVPAGCLQWPAQLRPRLPSAESAAQDSYPDGVLNRNGDSSSFALRWQAEAPALPRRINILVGQALSPTNVFGAAFPVRLSTYPDDASTRAVVNDRIAL